MLKNIKYIDESIINYLGKDNLSVLLYFSGNYDNREFPDGALWVQLVCDRIKAVALCDECNTLLFKSDDCDYEELSMLCSDNIISPNSLPKNAIDEYYLMTKTISKVKNEKGIYYKEYGKIVELWPNSPCDVLNKQYLNLKGNCDGQVVKCEEEIVSAGFISYNDSLSVLSDIYTKKEMRKKGYGKELVNKLLNCSKSDNIYLLCSLDNTEFYKKLGFKPVKTIYKYEKVE